MARRRMDPDEFSLFPFIDALSGVIGVLSLIIAVMAIMGLDSTRIIEAQWSSTNGLSPYFVECRDKKIIVHSANEEIQIDDLRQQSGRWSQIVAELDRFGNKYVVFIVRPDGIDSYWSAQRPLPKSLKRGMDVVDGLDNLKFGTRS